MDGWVCLELVLQTVYPFLPFWSVHAERQTFTVFYGEIESLTFFEDFTKCTKCLEAPISRRF